MSGIWEIYLCKNLETWGKFFENNKKMAKKWLKMAIAAGRQSYPCNEEQTFYTPVTTACCVPQQIPVRNMIERTQQENLLSWGPPLVMLRFWTKTSKRSVGGAPRW